MPDRLLLRLNADASLAWLTQDAAGRPLSGATAGAPPSEILARALRIAVLVPSEDVLLLEAPALSRQRAQLAKAIPFALEERLASPVEDLHFALADAPVGATIAVAVVARALLRDWLDTLAAHAIVPDVLIPETLALPYADGAVTLLLEGQRALLRSGAAQASACEIGTLPAWLAAHAPNAIEVWDFRAAAALDLGAKISRYHERQRDPLAYFATQLKSEPTPNLLQGEFAPRHRQVPAQRLWRLAAILVGAALLLGFAYAVGDWLRLSRESTQLDVAMREVLHTSFPKLDQVAGDPHQLMQSELARLRGDSEAGGVLRVLSQIAPVLGSSVRVVLKGIEYHNTTLELSLRAPDVPTLDLVREQLSNLGLNAEVTSVSATSGSGDNSVEGRVRINLSKS